VILANMDVKTWFVKLKKQVKGAAVGGVLRRSI